MVLRQLSNKNHIFWQCSTDWIERLKSRLQLPDSSCSSSMYLNYKYLLELYCLLKYELFMAPKPINEAKKAAWFPVKT